MTLADVSTWRPSALPGTGSTPTSAPRRWLEFFDLVGRSHASGNFEIPDEPVLSAISSVYDTLAPQLTRYVRRPHDGYRDPLAGHAEFHTPYRRAYEWSRSHSADEWVAMVTTFSDYQVLPSAQLEQIQDGLRHAINSVGGQVHARGGTYAIFAERR